MTLQASASSGSRSGGSRSRGASRADRFRTSGRRRTRARDESIREARIDTMTAEFATLREEIGRHQDHQRDLLNQTFLAVAAMFSVAGAAAGTEDATVRQATTFALLFFPWAFLMLACLYADRTIRLLACADYLHNYLRPRLGRLVGSDDVWQWERYKQAIHNGEIECARGRSHVRGLILDRLRWFIFVGSGAVAIALFVGISGWGPGAAGRIDLDLRLAGALTFGIVPVLVIVRTLASLQETFGVVRSEPLPSFGLLRSADATPAPPMAARVWRMIGRAVRRRGFADQDGRGGAPAMGHVRSS